MTDDEKKQIAALVVDELMQRLRIGVGNTVLSGAWKVLVGMMIAAAIYGLAKSGQGATFTPLEIHRQ
jgi:hypothetical protein